MKETSSTSSFASASKPSKAVFCKHNYKAVLKKIGKGRDVGKYFYGCPLWPNGCGFFVLEEDLQMQASSGWSYLSDIEMKIYDDKLKKLKLKKEMFKIEVTYLKDELSRQSKLQKMLMYALLSSWIIFAFIWMVKM